MVWVPVAAWIAAVVIAAVVLGFCAYELRWKAGRLRADLARLGDTSARLSAVQAQAGALAQELASARARGGGE